MQLGKLDQVMQDLETYEGELAHELGRVQAALAALRGVGGSSASPTREADGPDSQGTFDLLRQIFKENPDKEYDANGAIAELDKRGWDTDAQDRVNAVRSALARLTTWEEIERTRRGYYRLAGEVEDVPPDRTAGEQPQRPQEPADDPWASAPPAPAHSDFSDEPPF